MASRWRFLQVVVLAVLVGDVAPTTAAEKPERVRIALVAGVDAKTWAARSGGWGATIDLVWSSALAPEVRATLARENGAEVRKRWLADPSVLWIEPEPEIRLMSADAAWWIQSADDVTGSSDYAISAPLFAHGITGRGMILGHCDEGLENDDCGFLYGASIDEAAWAPGPAATDPDPVPAEERLVAGAPVVRTRERKIIAYLVQLDADPGSSPGQHGTHGGGVVDSDMPDALAARPLVRDAGERQFLVADGARGGWRPWDDLRGDLSHLVDDPQRDDPALPHPNGASVQHHGFGDGIAPGAQVVLQDIGRSDGMIASVPPVEALLLQASKLGASTWFAPWGSCGIGGCVDCYDTDSRGIDAATWCRRDLVAVVPVGNNGGDGPRSITGSIAQAKNAVAVGATEHAREPSCAGRCPAGVAPVGEAMATFSGIGPVSGGRIGPLLVTPGVVHARATSVVQPEDGTGSGDDACPAQSEELAGTSFSAAVAAGASLLVQQYFADGWYPTGTPRRRDALRPTNALVKAVLVDSTRPLRGDNTSDGTNASRPNMRIGFGGPVLDDALYFAGDPSRVRGRTVERSRLLVLDDVPNGFDGSWPLASEPGGLPRDRIVSGFRPALSADGVQEWNVLVDASSRGEDLRFTLAWSDLPSSSAAAPLVNDLDLEVISPGPDGVLQTKDKTVMGDDVLYRTSPATEWSNGASSPSSDGTLLSAGDDRPGRDGINTVECVFVPPGLVVPGAWRVRVVAWAIRGTGTYEATPNVALADAPLTRDLDGDGRPDSDAVDVALGSRQGYALIASGPVRVSTPPLRPRDPHAPRHDVPPPAGR